MNKRNGGKATTLNGANRQIKALENAMEKLRGLMHKRDRIIADLEICLESEKAKAVELFDEIVRLKIPVPIPIRLECPDCGELHIDEGEWETRVHHTHSCQKCGLTWRPAVVATVGVRFLPGFQNLAEQSPELLLRRLMAGDIELHELQEQLGYND